MGLTFSALRAANIDRLPQFRDAKGRLCHSKADGSDWPLSQWSNAVCGELGEAANIIKKIERGDYTLEEAREKLGKELADVVTYIDLLASVAGVDLGRATADKFNEVSKRVGATSRLYTRGMIYLASPHSHPDPAVREDRYRQVCRVAADFFASGTYVYCPIAHTHQIAQSMHDAMSWDAWRAYDTYMLSLCEMLIVVKLDGWEESLGVAAEIELAQSMGLPLRYFTPAKPPDKPSAP